MGSTPVYALEETEPVAAVAAQTATPETAEPAETTSTPEVQGAPEQENVQLQENYVEKTVSDVGTDLPDNDQLFALYLQQTYPDRVPSAMANWGEAEDTLNERELASDNTEAA